MRLIDADDFFETFPELDNEPYNNFPTVDITEEQAIDKLHETGWMQKHDKEMTKQTEDDLIKAFELLKAHCKNRECNKDCVFYRELRICDNTEQFCGLCEIVLEGGIE